MLIRESIQTEILKIKVGDRIRYRQTHDAPVQTFPIELSGDVVILKRFFASHPGTYYHETIPEGGFFLAAVRTYTQDRLLSRLLPITN